MFVDFFNECCCTSSSKQLFGLCDDTPPPSNPAYIDEANDEKWDAIIQNKIGKAVNFFAIDNCVVLLRSDGKEDKKCDGVLKYEENLVFIEIKDRRRRGSDWLFKDNKGKRSGAFEQLAVTIDHFKKSYDITSFKKVEAYACNKSKPRVNVDHKVLKERFKNETGVRFYAQRTISI